MDLSVPAGWNMEEAKHPPSLKKIIHEAFFFGPCVKQSQDGTIEDIFAIAAACEGK